jgi:hypothetical protein
MFNQREENFLWGSIFTSSKHFLAPLGQKTIVCMHHFDLVFRRVQHRRHIGCFLCGGGKDVSVVHQ